MTDITQADREAAASGYFAWCSANSVIPERMVSGNADDHSMVQAFANHREAGAAEERAKIVAWLHEAGYRQIAVAIEAEEHLK
jgi:hypothetical protein